MRLSPEDIEALTADPWKHELPMPSLEEISHSLFLLKKQYPVDTWVLKRRLKWLVKKMNKHYDVKWTTPWDKQ